MSKESHGSKNAIDPKNRFVVQSLSEFSFHDDKGRADKIDAQGNKYDPETRLPIRDDEGKNSEPAG